MIDLAEYTQLAATIAGISEVLLAFAFFYLSSPQEQPVLDGRWWACQTPWESP